MSPGTRALALALLAGLACRSSAERVALDNSDNGHRVAAAVGDHVEVTLQTIGPGQYGTPALSSPSVLFLGVSPVDPPNPGGPRQLYRFEAASPGRADVTIPHESGAPTGPAVEPFHITIDVQ